MRWWRRDRSSKTDPLEKTDGKSKMPSIRNILLKELRNLSLLCLGLIVYLVLYRSFSGIHRQSIISEDTQLFPRKIWQSWKVDPTRFEDRDAERARTWVVKNPSLRYEVLTDGNGLAYVEEVFGPARFNRPDIIHTYKSLNAKIIQADLLRYIIMYAEGGIWADIDVEAIRSFDHFIPKRFNEHDLDMIIGVETDEPDFKDHPVLGSKAQSFCQWTFVCKPQLPVMLQLIDHILLWLDGIAQKEGKSISEIELDFDQVLSGTGPSAFTSAILAQMSKVHGSEVTWQEFHDLKESAVVGGILVLPAEAFAAGTGHSDSGNHGGKGALVKHHFHASSWTKSHLRFKHPIYGEVEKCNWNVECVKLWDINTAFFDSLTQQEQSKMIAIKELDDSNSLKIEMPVAGPITPGVFIAPATEPKDEDKALPEFSMEKLDATEKGLDVPTGSDLIKSDEGQPGEHEDSLDSFPIVF